MVKKQYGHLNVSVKAGTIRQIIAGKVDVGRFDFVYSAGLFDYLSDEVARSLIEKMVEMTNPGGDLLVANFLPDISDEGYMETFMGWELIFRNRNQIEGLFCDIIDRVDDMKYFTDPDGNIGFVKIVVK